MKRLIQRFKIWLTKRRIEECERDITFLNMTKHQCTEELGIVIERYHFLCDELAELENEARQ